ncbi:hypothetical protein BC940DRAFT_364956 [Gongronella butleri]|nr:hypothetical protein BC940DRAFT_364956 [Gongronella butleri]
MTLSQDQPALNHAPSMAPLYDQLLKRPFPDTVSAIEHCRKICAEFGFTVKQEASANRNIYVYCSREGLPDSQRHPKTTPQRKRPSKRCDCRWRVVLSENEQHQWEFRKSMNPNASEHNHEMMSPSEMIKAWPAQVNDMIIYLAQQHLQTHEIRDAVKQRFPDITWNERRFYNRLTEERKRIRQRYTVDRTRRLLSLSAQLCALVASNEEWAQCVQGDMQRMVDNFTCLIGDLAPASDLQMDGIQNIEVTTRSVASQVASTSSSTASSSVVATSDESPSKKRKLPTMKGVQTVMVPSFHLYVRSSRSPQQRSPESSSLSSPPPVQAASSSSMPMAAAGGVPNIITSAMGTTSNNTSTGNSAFLLASPTSSSSSSSRPFRIDMRFSPPPSQGTHQGDDATFMLSPPPAPMHHSHHQHPTHPHQQTHHPHPHHQQQQHQQHQQHQQQQQQQQQQPYYPYPNPFMPDLMDIVSPPPPSSAPSTTPPAGHAMPSAASLPPRPIPDYPTERYDPMLRPTENAFY